MMTVSAATETTQGSPELWTCGSKVDSEFAFKLAFEFVLELTLEFAFELANTHIV